MKKILFLFLFGFTLASAEINEYLSDVYFANGIDTDERTAKKSIENIRRKFKLSNPQAYQYVNDWNVSYNHTHGIGIDLYESMLQKIDEHWYTESLLEVSGLLDYSWKGLFKMVAKKVAKEEIKEQAEKYAVQIAEKLIAKYGYEYGGVHLTKGDIVAIFASGFEYAVEQATDAFLDIPEDKIKEQEAADIEKQFTAYTQSIKDGHGVVVVAHSQGNLFTNLAYDMFENHWIPWNEDTEWMKPYFTAMAVASPATDILGKSEPSITFENDIIQLAPDSLPALEPNPTKYYYDNATMGERLEVRYSMEAHAFLTSYMATDTTRNKILSFINESILDHKKQSSQWNPKNKGCLCKEKYVKMTHKFDPDSMDQYLLNEKVKDFAEGGEGKIYKADAGNHAEYVRALDGDRSDDGVFAIEEVEEDDVCYVLKDDTAGEIGSVEGANVSSMAVPESGIITISLDWNDADVALSLNSAIGTKDIAAKECLPFEHYFVKSEVEVEPGTYGVYVNHSGEVEDDSLPQKVKIDIHAPGTAMVFDLSITAADMLNLGHVANIIISEDTKSQVVLVSTGSVNTGSANNGSGGSVKCYGECGVSASGTYVEYLYGIQSKLKQALLGPLSTAYINLTNAEDFLNSVPFYESITSDGDSIVTAGLFYFTDEALALLTPDTYHVMSVVGGNDIDANDDGIADTIAKPNLGSIHAVVSTDTVTNENFKVNILTEVAFQLTAELMTQELNTTELQKRLDYIAKRLLIQDVDGSGEIDYDDLLAWVPTVDKNKLRKPYATFYEPIVQKIYRNEAIYDDAYALAYKGIFKEREIKLDENASAGTIVAQVKFEYLDAGESYTLVEENDFFEILGDGTIILKDGSALDYETNSTILLHVQATSLHREITTAKIPIGLNNIPEFAPTLGNLTLTMHKDTKIGTVIGDILKDSGDTSLSAIEILSSSPFAVDLNGNVRVTTSLLEANSNSYALEAEAANAFGKSNRSHLNITFVAPVIHDMSLKVFDNSVSLSEVGIIEIVKNGNPIETITLSGDGSSDFTIDTNGVIRVADGVRLDASKKDSYTLTVRVNNSVEATVTIVLYKRILASLDTPDRAHGVTLSSDEAKAYVADGYSGLQIIDVSDPNMPTIVSSIDTPGYATSVTLSGDGTIAYVADNTSGLQIIDVSDPTVPTILASINTPRNATRVTLSADGTKVFMADGYAGLRIIDVSDPAVPIILASINTPGYAEGVALSADDTKAYVADGNLGLLIIDMSDLTTVTILSSVNTPGNAENVVLSADGTKAYVADNVSGLQIIDVSNPAVPTILASIDTPDYTLSVVLSADGTKAFMADVSSGLQVIDVSDSTVPTILTSINTPGYAWSVVLSADGTKAYVADNISGLQIIDLSGL